MKTPESQQTPSGGSDQILVRLYRGDGQAVNPAYPSQGYEEFCEREKAKGLRRDLWETLPQLWDDELKFRAEFEDALAKFSEPNADVDARRAGAPNQTGG